MERLLVELPRVPLGIAPDEGVRLSLAGLQQKLVLVRDARCEWGQPIAGEPSTHILKPAPEAYPALVVNELSFLLGNSDQHGKNSALLYTGPDGVRLAPIYDVVSTAVYPELSQRLAMTIGGEVEPERVDVAAWQRLAAECGLGGGLPARVRERASSILGGGASGEGAGSRSAGTTPSCPHP